MGELNWLRRCSLMHGVATGGGQTAHVGGWSGIARCMKFAREIAWSWTSPFLHIGNVFSSPSQLASTAATTTSHSLAFFFLRDDRLIIENVRLV